MQVTLRPLSEQDAFTSVNWRNNPAIWEYTGSAPSRPITIEDELAWVRRVISDDTSRRFAILANDQHVGNIYLTDIHDRVAEYHIFIGDTDFWGKGVARKASELIIEFGRSNLGLQAITLRVSGRNDSALRLYRSLGFVPEGEADGFIQMQLALSD